MNMGIRMGYEEIQTNVYIGTDAPVIRDACPKGGCRLAHHAAHCVQQRVVVVIAERR